MAATAAQIRDRAATILGVLRLNQTLQAQDATRISSGYLEVYEQLKKDGRATWAYSGSVPSDMTPHVAYLIAENCLDTYGVSDKRYARIVRGAERARREIDKFSTEDYVSQDQADNF